MKIIKKRKQFVISILLLSFISLVYMACRKQLTHNDKNLSEFISSAKSWFINTVVENEKSRMYQNNASVTMNVFERKFARMISLSKIIDWHDAVVYTIDKIDFVVAPVEEATKPFKNQNYEAIRRLIFYNNANGSMCMYIIEIISDKGGSLGDISSLVKTALLNKHFNKRYAIPNTNASIFFYDEKYRQLGNYKISNGKWDKSGNLISNIKGRTVTRKISTMAKTTTCQTCETWYTVGFWYDLGTGQIVHWEILNEYQVCVDNYPPFGGGGSNDPGQTTDCVNSCTETANELSNAQVSSETVSIDVVDIDGITKHKNPKWKILNNVTWSLHSQEQGVVELVDQLTNKWVWRELSHPANAVTKSGITVGGQITWTNGTGTPSFTAGTPNVLYAGMSLNFDVTYQPVCNCPGVQEIIPSYTQAYTANAIWPANPN